MGGRYVLGGLLGSGGMGRVYRAYDENLGRDVALKVLEEHRAGTPEFVERFEREAMNAASLNHPNIVRVFDSGEDESGPPFMAMELIGGGTLKDRIRARGPLPPREAAKIALQVAEALAAAHAAGIVHRDIKPENVLLAEDGEAKVTDFGIAKATEATVVTHTSMILGTAPYLSPEQAQGEPVGPASDLYSLGVVLYEALTGRPPFATGEHVNPLAVAMKHVNEPAPAARLENPHVPEPLEKITLALMRKEPAARHASAAILADDLEAFLEDRPLRSEAVALLDGASEFAETGVLPRAPADRPPRRGRRGLVPVLAIMLAALFVLSASLLVARDPLELGTRLASPDSTSVASSVFPEVRGAPDPPAPTGEGADAPEQDQAAGGLAPEEPTPDEPTPPTADSVSSASASADASASAPAEPTTTEPDPGAQDASASASAAAPEEQDEPAPQPAPSSAPPSSAAPSDDPAPAVPVVPETPDVESPGS